MASMTSFNSDVAAHTVCLMSLIIHHTIHKAQAATNIRFVHGQYKLQAIDAARADALANIVNRKKPKNRYAPAQIEDFPWYHTLPDAMMKETHRFRHIAKLTMRLPNPKNPASPIFENCSAAYVGKDILFTAGHCIVHPGIVKPEETLIVVAQDYNGKFVLGDKQHKGGWDAKGRVVTDWWVPEKFYNNHAAGVDSDAWGYDYAFLKVDQPKKPDQPNSQVYSFYDLVPPDATTIKAKPDVLLIGYPSDVPRYFRPVQVNAKLHAGSDEEVKTLDLQIDDIQYAKNRLVLVGKEKGVMFRGASGGPVFKDGSDDAKVIGVLSFMNDLQNKAILADKSKMKQEGVVTPLITADLVAVLELLRRGPEGEAQISPAIGNPIMQACNWLCKWIKSDTDEN